MNLVRMPLPRTCTQCERGIVVSAGDDSAHFARASVCACSASCSTCSNTGYVFRRTDDGVFSSACSDCTPLRERARRYNAAGIPRRYASSTVSSYNAETASQKAAAHWFRERRDSWIPGNEGLLLSGGVGTGKTHLMCAWLRYLTLHRDISARFIEFSHLLADIKAGYSAGRSDAEIIGHLVDVPVLVIDELGKQLNTDWQLGILDALISTRYERNRSTFFTTNYAWEAPKIDHRSTDDFARREISVVVGERIASRIEEMCARIHLIGTDYRRRGVASAHFQRLPLADGR